MQVTIDTRESLDDVLRVIGAAYGVEIPAVPKKHKPTVPVQRSSATHRGRRAAASSGADIRAWARSTGYAVSDRGRLAQDVVHAYESAHRGSRSSR